MSNEQTDKDKYLAQLEFLFMVTMYKLGNDVVVTDEELNSIKTDTVLDVTNVENGLRLKLVNDV